MEKQSTEQAWESSPTWEGLEAFARHGVQRLLQRVLEEEVDSVLGRERYERRAAVDAAGGYRNGYGKPRRLSVMAGTITVLSARGVGPPRNRNPVLEYDRTFLPGLRRRPRSRRRWPPPGVP